MSRPVRLAALVLLVAASALFTCAAADAVPSTSARTTNADEASAVAWLARTARPLSSEAPTAEQLKPLLARLSGARVIAIGEAVHGADELLAFKSALTKALVSAGRINAVALPVNLQAGRRLDAYIAGGTGTAGDALNAAAVPLAWSNGEVAKLLDWLRAWNAGGNDRIRIVGVDVQDVLRDTQSALSLLSEIEPEAASALQEIWKSELIEEKLQRSFGEVAREWSREQWETLFVAAQVLEDLLARPTTRLSQAPGFTDARHAARAARLGMIAFEFDVGGTPASQLPAEAYTRRDTALGDNLLAIVGAPARAVFWAHDSQIARGAYRSSETFNTGDYLADRLGGAYRTVGFAWRRGTLPSGTADRSATPTSLILPAQSLGALLAKTGHGRAWFDLAAMPKAGWAARWRARPYDRGWYGADIAAGRAPPTPLGDGIDILVFFDAIGTARRTAAP